MSILHLVKCEVCDNTHPFEPMVGPAYSQLPDSWLILVEGKTQAHDGYNFCSRFCLARWLSQKGTSMQIQAFKGRRFWLVHPQKESIEGIKWEDGSVSLPDGQTWSSWANFKRAHDLSAVQWIDFPVGGGE